MKRVLFLCEGNVCRSPMAAALFNSHQNPNFLAVSAGTDADAGDGMSPTLREVLDYIAVREDVRSPYCEHRSHRLSEEDFADVVAVVCLSDLAKEQTESRFALRNEVIFEQWSDIPAPAKDDFAEYLPYLSNLRPRVDDLYRRLTEGEKEGVFPMIEGDLDEVMALENICFSTPWSRDSMVNSIRCPSNRAIVFKKEGKIVGYATYSVLYETGELYNIAVDPACRRSGIGKALLENVITHCRAVRVDNLFLEVRRSNESARAMYERFGFVYDSVRKNYYRNPREDALLMHLSLEKR